MSLLQELITQPSTQTMIFENLLNYGVLGIAVIAGGLFFKKYLEKQEHRDEESRKLILQLMEENRQNNEDTQNDFNEYLQLENKSLRDIVKENGDRQEKMVKAFTDTSNAITSMKEVVSKFIEKNK